MKKVIAFCIAISLLIALASVSAFSVDVTDFNRYNLYVYFVGQSSITAVPSSNITVNGNDITVTYSNNLFNHVRVWLYGTFDHSLYFEDHSYFTQIGNGPQSLNYAIFVDGNTTAFRSTSYSVPVVNFRENFSTEHTINRLYYDYIFTNSGQTTPSITFHLNLNIENFTNDQLTVVNKVTDIDQKLTDMMNYESQGGSSDLDGASDMAETIAGDVSNINNTIQQHTPHVQNWFETSPVATDLVNIALLANSWLPAYLNCDPDVSFYWGLVTFCILLTLIENGLRRRPWHGFDDGGDFESEYDVTSTDEKGRSRTIHNKVSGSRRRIR